MEKEFIVTFEIGVVVEIDTDAENVSQLTEEEKGELMNKACAIVEEPGWDNIVDIMEN